ncbi:MAG: hypothetical protein R2813_13535 [Flavobacteriales bacterium]
MKKAAFLILIPFYLGSCSTCYECTEDVIQYSGNTPTDTVAQSDEFCTSDQAEVEAREDAGATCRVN